MTKFMTQFGTIEEVEVERETSSSVYVGGRRCAKASDWRNYFDTYAEAKACVLGRLEADAAQAKDRLDYAERKLSEATAKL